MMKYLFLIFFFTSSCTQGVISYVNNINKKPLIDIDTILMESGLILQDTTASKEMIEDQVYPSGTLQKKSNERLKKFSYTLAVKPSSKITIKADTENYLQAQPYFSSEEIVYDANMSNPSQGNFVFMIGNKPGEIKIRLYHPDTGILKKEITWYIELAQ